MDIFWRPLYLFENIEKSRIKVLFRLYFSVILPCTMSLMGRFRNNFKDHRPLLEQLFESKAAIGKPGLASWNRLLEGFSLIVNDFTAASRNFIFDVTVGAQSIAPVPKKCEYPIFRKQKLTSQKLKLIWQFFLIILQKRHSCTSCEKINVLSLF